jgi:hypothetical protein
MNTSEAIKILENSGYRVTQIGVRGRKSKLKDTPLDKMTPIQRKSFLYRKRNREKILAYHRKYYRDSKPA